MPLANKTIKPVSIGGAAGGEKYLVNGILFKFALDFNKIYGGDENAAKAAGHDLKVLCLIRNLQSMLPKLFILRTISLITVLGFNSFLPRSVRRSSYAVNGSNQLHGFLPGRRTF